jgi:hypothetical protein
MNLVRIGLTNEAYILPGELLFGSIAAGFSIPLPPDFSPTFCGLKPLSSNDFRPLAETNGKIKTRHNQTLVLVFLTSRSAVD